MGRYHAAALQLETSRGREVFHNLVFQVQSSLRDSTSDSKNPGVKTPGYYQVVATRLKWFVDTTHWLKEFGAINMSRLRRWEPQRPSKLYF